MFWLMYIEPFGPLSHCFYSSVKRPMTFKSVVDFKSQNYIISSKVSRTLPSIQVNLKSAMICIVLILHPISYYPSLFSSPSRAVSRTPSTIFIATTFMFQSFYCSLARYNYSSIFLLSFLFSINFEKL